MIEFNGEIFENEYELLGFQKAQTDAQRVKKSQMLRKCVPTKADYIELKNILKDFGYKVKNIVIPEFNTKAEMSMWQKSMIDKKINKYNRYKSTIK